MVPNRLKELRQKSGLTLQELAAATGTTAPQVNKLERGDRRMTIDWMVRLAPALGVEPKDLMAPSALYMESSAAGPEPSADHGTAMPGHANPGSTLGPTLAPTPGPTLGPAPLAGDPRDLIPVRGAARGGNEQEMFLQDGAIDFVRRPPWLAHVRDAYTIYVVGDSMWPRFRQGQLLHVNPHKPPRPGAGVVVVKRGNEVLMKEFVKRTAETLVLQQLNPDQTLEFPLADIVSVATVIGIEEP